MNEESNEARRTTMVMQHGTWRCDDMLLAPWLRIEVTNAINNSQQSSKDHRIGFVQN